MSAGGNGTDHSHYSDAFLRDVLDRTKSIAVVGASADPVKASYFVVKYLRDAGYRVFPVNPKMAGQSILGQTVYGSLAELPEPPDMVDVFRNSAAAGGVTDEAIAIGAKVVWMQLGVVNEEAAARAEAAGLTVVMNRCPKMEIQRLYGEIGRIGVNSGVLVTKKQPLKKSFKKLI
ncbi:CoA-binding protein [Azospirillum doebereinerae]|uniref:CoA-binding protein n=1 Tax=Azospirillum doebereinerae TaxID=92933 RepID=A0A3S0V3Q5_9PROT|nr:CoA-binding protein [Azospirillum doebereinerae]MCG5239078.1 CoA-binding protein [Azospirillum doebereinerae]RUQ75722.1 CoA-binding protein [Azospirillum doebereinerae]